MKNQHVLTLAAPGTGRDERLRLAHHRAFEQIRKSLPHPDHETRVRLAVEELVDACEDYLRNQLE